MGPMTRAIAAALLLAVVPFGCTAVSTYPPTAGRTTLTPNVTPGPELMSGSLREAHRIVSAATPGTELVYNLPAGLGTSTWRRVESALPAQSRPMKAGDTAVFSVQQIRLSGGSAEVDVLAPENGVYQLMTMRFEGGAIAGWRLRSSYRWMIPTTPPVANTPAEIADASE